jgi:hypothetical protein
LTAGGDTVPDWLYAGAEPRATGIWWPLAYMHCMYAAS